MKHWRCALMVAVLGYASGALPEQIFSSDIESGTLGSIFYDTNGYGGVQFSISTDLAHSGSRSVKIAYLNDEAGVELRIAPFGSTKSLYTRKYEYYAAGWENNWPAGLKTSRYFTRPDWTYGSAPFYAYMSEKFIWNQGSGYDDELSRGLNHAIGDYDIIKWYPSGTLFGNGMPNIRTGHWYKYETWMVLDSAVDAGDGIIRCWIDDQLVLDRTNVSWRSTARNTLNGTGWQSMWFGGNYTNYGAGPSKTVYRYIDDLYVSTTLDRDVASKPNPPSSVIAE